MSSIEPNPLEVVCKKSVGKEREKYYKIFIFKKIFTLHR